MNLSLSSPGFDPFSPPAITPLFQHERSMTDSVCKWKGEVKVTVSNLHRHREGAVWHTGSESEQRWQQRGCQCSEIHPPVAGTIGPPLPVLYSADNNSPSAADTARGVPPRAGWHPKQQINSHFSPASRSFNSTSREMKSSVWWPSPRSAPNLCCKVTLNVSRPTSLFASPGSASLIHLNAVIPCQTVLSCLISEPQAVRGTCHPNPTSDYRVSQRSEFWARRCSAGTGQNLGNCPQWPACLQIFNYRLWNCKCTE